MLTQPNGQAGIGSVTVGNMPLSLGGLKILRAVISTTGYSSFTDISPGVTPANYSVPNGKTFYIRAAYIDQTTATGNTGANSLQAAYGDAFVGPNSGSPPANIKGVISGASPDARDNMHAPQVIGSTEKSIVFGGSVPTGKFPVVLGGGAGCAGVVLLYGYEA